MLDNAVILRAFFLLEGSPDVQKEILRFAQDDSFVNAFQKWPKIGHDTFINNT